MRKLDNLFYSVIFAGCLLLLTSCLGDPATSLTMANQAGVVVTSPKKMIYLKGGDIVSSDAFQDVSVDDGECVLVDYSIDYSAADNANGGTTNGYYTATIYPSSLTKVDKGDFIIGTVDTLGVRANELTVKALQSRCAYIRGQFFLFAELANHPSDEKDQFMLSCNPNQPTTDNVYTLYLRVVKNVASSTTSTSTMIIPYAFPIENFIRTAKTSTDKDGNTVVKFHVNYVSSFSTDTTYCNWSTSELFSIPVSNN